MIAGASGTHYQIMALMDPRDEVIVHDFNMVLVAACRKPDKVSFGLMKEDDDAYTRALLEQAASFYAAPDFDTTR